MKRPILAALAATLLSGCVMVSARETPEPAVDHESAGPVVRAYASPTAAYAKSVVIPQGYETIRLPGIVADPLNPGSAAAAQYGDTERQTANIFAKIAATLAELGIDEGDVVAMTIYLVPPAGSTVMDFDGMMRSYTKHYGGETQPNRPARTTVAVVGVPGIGRLAEIEVTAVRPAH